MSYSSEWQRNRRLKDPEWRAKSNARDRERSKIREKDPIYRAKVRKRKKERLLNDPEHHDRLKLYQREWKEKRKKDPNYYLMHEHKKRKERYWQDPEYRAMERAKQRAWKQEKMKDPLYREQNNAWNRLSYRRLMSNSTYCMYYNERKRKERQRLRDKDPIEYLRIQNERGRMHYAVRYKYDPVFRAKQNKRIKERKLDPIFNTHFKEQAKKNYLIRMQNPLYRARYREYHQEWCRTHREQYLQTKRRYRARQKLLRDPMIQEKLAQAVLVQLEQLGFPTSVIKGILQ
jgi:hypothetical protein